MVFLVIGSWFELLGSLGVCVEQDGVLTVSHFQGGLILLDAQRRLPCSKDEQTPSVDPWSYLYRSDLVLPLKPVVVLACSLEQRCCGC